MVVSYFGHNLTIYSAMSHDAVLFVVIMTDSCLTLTNDVGL